MVTRVGRRRQAADLDHGRPLAVILLLAILDAEADSGPLSRLGFDAGCWARRLDHTVTEVR